MFLENRGPHILVDFYERTCVILHGRQYDRSLTFDEDPLADEFDGLMSPGGEHGTPIMERASRSGSFTKHGKRRISRSSGSHKDMSDERCVFRPSVMVAIRSLDVRHSAAAARSAESPEMARRLARIYSSEASGAGVSTNSETGDDESSVFSEVLQHHHDRDQGPHARKRDLEKAISTIEQQRGSFPGGDMAVSAALTDLRAKVTTCVRVCVWVLSSL